MIELVVATLAAIVISATCSMVEAVLYSVPVSHVEAVARQGRSTGRVLRGLRRNVERPIAAILSLNTIANTGGAAIAGAAASSVFGHHSLPWFSAAFTLAVLVFSEVVPKTAGVVYSRPLSTIIAHPLRLLVVTFTPLVWLTQFVTRLVARRRVDPSVSEEELIIMARLGLESGTIDADEAEVIENILALGNKSTRDVMTPRPVVVALQMNTTVRHASLEEAVLEHSRLPVWDENLDDVVGIVHRRDLLKALANERDDHAVAELMRPVHFVIDSLRLDRLLRMFLERRQHLFVAIDEHGGVAGVVTLEDVLEEILGREIVDEFDRVADLRDMARKRREALLKDWPRQDG